MATPSSSAYNFHHRFDAVPDKQASTNGNSALNRPPSEHLEYPDLDTGKVYTSAPPSATTVPVLSKLPDFPEFKSFDSKPDLFQNNSFFQQYSTASHPAASAAMVEPQSELIEGSPSSDQIDSGSAATRHSVPENLAHVAAESSSVASHAQIQQLQPHGINPAEMERHFSSASSYVQSPSSSMHTSNLPSEHSHSSARNPLPRPSSIPASPVVQPPHINGHSIPQALQSGSALASPTQSAAATSSSQAQPSTQQSPPRPKPDELNMAALRIGDGDRSSVYNSAPPMANRDENAERDRNSSFFGMQRPAAALSATGQQVPVPAGVLADDDDGFYQDQEHLSQSNGATLRNQDNLNQGPRPSSFFGMQSDSASSLNPEAIFAPSPVGEVSIPSSRGSSLRTDPMPRGVSTAAGGTGNGPMPSSGGLGGLGPSGATRPASIAPSMASGPLLDHSHLKVGQQASLLSHGKTLELYRQNAKKTNDPNLIYELAVFMIDAAKTMGTEDEANGTGMATNGPKKVDTQKEELMKEATGLLKKIADRGHPDAQYFLADCYANGIGTRTGKQDFGQAYTYFVLAAKHGHPDAAYRAGTCYEKGWGCRKDAGKAIQFYRKSAAQSHPGAMYRLATAELNGELGLKKNAKEGVKWLKRSAEAATPEFPHALHELALLHERGIDNVLFVDPEYSCELLAQAGELGYAPSAYKLGVNYEYGRMGCPQDGGLSIHMYNIAAQQNHKEACFALTAWYLVGAPGILPQSDTEAYLWAKKAAEQGLAKAEYAVGYFTEMGIGTVKDLNEAKAWYKKAAEHGDKRANQRIAALQGRGGPTGHAGNGANAQPAPPSIIRQSRMGQKQEQRESMNEFGRRAQPTSAPFPASVTQSSMTPSTQMNYPTPLAIREAQTAQREQQYMANVAANERARAQLVVRPFATQQEHLSGNPGGPSHHPMGPSPHSVGPSPMSAAVSPSAGLPRPPQMPMQHQRPPPPRQNSNSTMPPVPFSQPGAYPSYPMSAGAGAQPPRPFGNGPMSPSSPTGNAMSPISPRASAMYPGGPGGPEGPGSQFIARPGMGPGPRPGPGPGQFGPGGPGGPGGPPPGAGFGGARPIATAMATAPGSSPASPVEGGNAGKDEKKKKSWFGR